MKTETETKTRYSTRDSLIILDDLFKYPDSEEQL